jgi:hypothetical protein
MGLAVSGAIVAGGACARPAAPPGGPADSRPPGVIATYPTELGTLDELDGVIRFEFDERISERVVGGSLDAAVSISPEVGVLKVSHSRTALKVEAEEGFEAGRVYRVTLQAVVSDMFGNQLKDPFELVFSTGGDPVPTTLAGQVWERVSGRGSNGAIVLATDSDGLTHKSVANQDGIFAFRYLPGGAFELTAFDDLNRNGEVDSVEVQGGVGTSLEVGDTVFVDVSILAPDSSAAVAMNAVSIDSVTVALEFDDMLDPDATLESVTLVVTTEDGTQLGIERVFHEAQYAEYVDSVTESFARLDSIDAAAAAATLADAAEAADTVELGDTVEVSDTVEVVDVVEVVDTVEFADTVEAADSATTPPQDTVIVAPRARPTPIRLDPLPGVRPGVTADGRRLLPGRRLVLRLLDVLGLDLPYELDASGVVNINGLADGGGSVPLVRESPPIPDSLPSSELETDTLAIADTLTGQPR